MNYEYRYGYEVALPSGAISDLHRVGFRFLLASRVFYARVQMDLHVCSFLVLLQVLADWIYIITGFSLVLTLIGVLLLRRYLMFYMVSHIGNPINHDEPGDSFQHC